MTARHSFWLDLLAPLFTRTVDKATFINPLTAAPLSLCLCLSRTLSPQHHLTVRAVRMVRCTKDQPFLLDDEIHICHNSTYGGGLSKLIKNWHVKSISKVNFQTDQWDDLIHQTATQTCARSRARPCSLQPSESHTTGTARKRDNSHPVSSRGQDRGNEKVGQG